MRLLLDTHILVWLVAVDSRLLPRLAASLAGDDLMISTASIWELSIKYHLGKLPSVGLLLEDVQGRADQLMAQALEDGLHLVSLDERVTAWAGAPLLNWR